LKLNSSSPGVFKYYPILEKMEIAEKQQKFVCTACDFGCSKQSDFDRHLATRKHVHGKSWKSKKSLITPQHVCSCLREFKTISGLWKHKKKCVFTHPLKTPDENGEINNQTNQIIMDIMKQNNDFQKLLLDQNKQMVEMFTQKMVIQNNTNYNNIVNNNNKFNLNVFLNEKCKDALNITDFVNSLQISFTDLENVGQMGFVEGISQIFVKGLKELDVCKRPIHCSDLKRETMYVKEDNVWGNERPVLIEAIKKIADKNIKTIPMWKKENPECRDSESKKSDQYLKIMGESLGACDKEKDLMNYNKIIKRVAKEVTIK